MWCHFYVDYCKFIYVNRKKNKNDLKWKKKGNILIG